MEVCTFPEYRLHYKKGYAVLCLGLNYVDQRPQNPGFGCWNLVFGWLTGWQFLGPHTVLIIVMCVYRHSKHGLFVWRCPYGQSLRQLFNHRVEAICSRCDHGDWLIRFQNLQFGLRSSCSASPVLGSLTSWFICKRQLQWCRNGSGSSISFVIGKPTLMAVFHARRRNMVVVVTHP